MFTTLSGHVIGKSHGQPRGADFSRRAQYRVVESFVEGSPFGNYRGTDSSSSPKKPKGSKK